MFPLGISDAEISKNVFLNKLPLNGVITLCNAIDFRLKENNYDYIDMMGYKNNIKMAFNDFLGSDALRHSTHP